ncbi:C40 family peptidase [Companilactobacillus halodurans]|uniref:NlpC/P60 family protein n=1 Tax=Companilactobacillus halodurans TaxID=2584183 RepID=A0A5P0ZUK7_9LACO|nr:NlpC/P60 family protein [Companilactobacillus halodurans]MQS96766.1 NlpC/P60 family protein [Companilactobacillus halodurans]
MNKKILTTLLLGTSLFGGTIFNPLTVNAADNINGVVTTSKVTFLYNQDGKKITNRALAANTPWFTNKKIELPKVGTSFQVATNEFVKASDVQLQTGSAANGIVRTKSSGALIYNYQTDKYVDSSNRLAGSSAWKYNRKDNFDGKTWYQVATNTWISSDDVSDGITIQNTGTAQISYAPASGTTLFNGLGPNKTDSGQRLANGTNWHFSQKVIDWNGDSWYEVGNNAWISGAFTKIKNTSFNEAAAKHWDPNFGAVKVTKNSGVYSDSKFSAKQTSQVSAGTIVEVASTVQEGSTIWYETSNGGWLPSTNVQDISVKRSAIELNGKTKSQAIEAVIASAKNQLGKPYVWNGKGPDGFDCSGLMQYVFRQVTGQNIGSWTVPQETAGTRVSTNQAKRGDLLFWGTPGASYHVALYLGNNQYLNALRPGTNVKIDNISNSFKPKITRTS